MTVQKKRLVVHEMYSQHSAPLRADPRPRKCRCLQDRTANTVPDASSEGIASLGQVRERALGSCHARDLHLVLLSTSVSLIVGPTFLKLNGFDIRTHTVSPSTRMPFVHRFSAPIITFTYRDTVPSTNVMYSTDPWKLTHLGSELSPAT